MRPTNMLLVDYDFIIIINNSRQIDFKGFQDFAKYAGDICGNILDDKTYMCYDPDAQTHSDFVSDVTVWSGYVPIYDTIIASFDILLARKNDPLYGLSGVEIFNKQNEIDASVVRLNFHIASNTPVIVTIPEGTFTFNGGLESSLSIQGAIELCRNLNEPVVNITDINNIKIEMSFNSADIVNVEIAKLYRLAFFTKQMDLKLIADRIYQ